MKSNNVWWTNEREYKNTDVPCSVCGYTGKPIARTSSDAEQIVCPNCGAKTRVYVGDYYNEGLMTGCWAMKQWKHGTLDKEDCDDELRSNVMNNIDNREEISKFIYMMGANGFDFNGTNIARAIGANPAFDKECWKQLAYLIGDDEPSEVNNNEHDISNDGVKQKLLEYIKYLNGNVISVPSVYGNYQSGYIAACRDIAKYLLHVISQEDESDIVVEDKTIYA